MGDSIDVIYNLPRGVEFCTWETTTSYKNWWKYKTGNMGLELDLYLVELIVCIIMDYMGLLVSTK